MKEGIIESRRGKIRGEQEIEGLDERFTLCFQTFEKSKSIPFISGGMKRLGSRSHFISFFRFFFWAVQTQRAKNLFPSILGTGKKEKERRKNKTAENSPRFIQ